MAVPCSTHGLASNFDENARWLYDGHLSAYGLSGLVTGIQSHHDGVLVRGYRGSCESQYIRLAPDLLWSAGSAMMAASYVREG
jgi:hypothetical protein